jgi:hypothetical protein
MLLISMQDQMSSPLSSSIGFRGQSNNLRIGGGKQIAEGLGAESQKAAVKKTDSDDKKNDHWSCIRLAGGRRARIQG